MFLYFETFKWFSPDVYTFHNNVMLFFTLELILFYFIISKIVSRRIILQKMQKASEKFNYFLFCRLKYKSKKNVKCLYLQTRSAKINYFYVKGIDWILREFVTKQFDKNQLFSCMGEGSD